MMKIMHLCTCSCGSDSKWVRLWCDSSKPGKSTLLATAALNQLLTTRVWSHASAYAAMSEKAPLMAVNGISPSSLMYSALGLAG